MLPEKFFNYKSLVEHIVEFIEKKITTGSLKPGQRITEDALTEAFGVSRSPVREAFRILEIQGFVSREPRRGISVAKITPLEAEEIYIIRANLESLAVYLSISKQNQTVLQQLKELHRKMVVVAESGDVQRYGKLNFKFHESLIGGCENRRLIQLIHTFSKQTMCYRLMLISRQDLMTHPGWMDASIKNHEAIIQAFESRDPESGEKLRKNHILENIPRIVKMLDTEENGVNPS